MSDAKVLEMLGLKPEDLIVLPELKRERLDMSRMRVYAVSKAEDAMGQFKSEYGTLPLYCITAPIGGRKKCDAWLCGPTPINEEQTHADERKHAATEPDAGTRTSIPAGDE